MSRPRVWLIPYLRGWSYDITARALQRHLAERFEIRIAYRGVLGSKLREWRPDLAVDLWWRGRARKLLPDAAVLKQVSSHRWGDERYLELDAARLTAKHLERCDGVVVPSRRLQAELGAHVPVNLGPKGFDPELFYDQGVRGGDLVVGWAGNASQADKRVELLDYVEPELRIADRCLVQSEMVDFYNGLDVVAIASDAEGDPRPLIEGMACGCFPVATDVGIVPELVRHGENGLIVEQNVESFAAAFAWCRANVELVRAAGRRNAIEMRRARTWAHVAPAWGDAFKAAIARRGSSRSLLAP